MTPRTTLSIAGVQHSMLHDHLFPSDGREAAAILLCALTPGPRFKLVVRDVLLVPHAECARRERDAITWPGAYLEQAIDRGESEALTIVLLHSHPGGLFAFSEIDDASDCVTIPALFQAYGERHGSAIMTPDGAVRARLYASDLVATPVDLVTCAERLRTGSPDRRDDPVPRADWLALPRHPRRRAHIRSSNFLISTKANPTELSAMPYGMNNLSPCRIAPQV